eukprot:8000809-Alexandrium_andersonii.AAC.1
MACSAGQRFARRFARATSCLDESNAFTLLETPPWRWPLMAGPRVRAGSLPVAWTKGRWADN